MAQSIGAAEARASVGARPGSAMRGSRGASTGGMGLERAAMSGALVVSRIIIHVGREVKRELIYCLYESVSELSE
jgi:hypothetical protein